MELFGLRQVLSKKNRNRKRINRIHNSFNIMVKQNKDILGKWRGTRRLKNHTNGKIRVIIPEVMRRLRGATITIHNKMID